jgi:hypothetical protein
MSCWSGLLMMCCSLFLVDSSLLLVELVLVLVLVLLLVLMMR